MTSLWLRALAAAMSASSMADVYFMIDYEALALATRTGKVETESRARARAPCPVRPCPPEAELILILILRRRGEAGDREGERLSRGSHMTSDGRDAGRGARRSHVTAQNLSHTQESPIPATP